MNSLFNTEQGNGVWFNEFDNVFHGIVGEFDPLSDVREITLDNGFITSKPLSINVYETKSEAIKALIETLKAFIKTKEEAIRLEQHVVDKYNSRIDQLNCELKTIAMSNA